MFAQAINSRLKFSVLRATKSVQTCESVAQKISFLLLPSLTIFPSAGWGSLRRNLFNFGNALKLRSHQLSEIQDQTSVK